MTGITELKNSTDFITLDALRDPEIAKREGELLFVIISFP